MILLLPAAMTLVFGVAFGRIGGGDTLYGIVVIDKDSSSWSEGYIMALNSSGLLNPWLIDDVTAGMEALRQGRVSAVLVIPDGFGDSIELFMAYPRNETEWVLTNLQLSIDQGSMIAGSVIPSILQQTLTVTLYGVEALTPPSPISIGAPELVASTRYSQFDTMVPGLFSYAIIFVTMIVSQVFTEERQQGILTRIGFTPTRTSDIFSAQIASNLITGLLQVTIVLGGAYLLGFRPNCSPLGLAMVYLLSLLLVLCNVGFGLITATLAKTSSVATGIAFIFILPQMMLGSFIPGIPENLSQLVPSYYVTQTLTNILLRGDSVTSITTLGNLLLLTSYTLLTLILGINLNKRKGA
jgi:ABC-2 type transport system permease protein